MTSGRRRENCHSLHRPILGYVEARHGRGALEAVVRRAGDPRPLDVIMDTSEWCGWDETRCLLEAAEQVLGSIDEVRRGAAHFDSATTSGRSAATVAAFEALGGPAPILAAISESASKFSSVVDMAPEVVGEREGIVVAHSRPGFPRYRMLCEATAGLLTITSALFGFPPASVLEEQCQARGDAACRFRVAWVRDPQERSPWRPHGTELARARAEFISLRSTVAELVAGHDVATLLQRIVEHASRAARAPQHLLAVRLPEDGDARVHAVGFDGHAATAACAREVLDGDGTSTPSRLVVDVRSRARGYGRLAACYPHGASFLPEERQNLVAFAELAAAALDSATAVADARRQAESSEALLELARAVADVATRDEVAARLAAAVPRVVDSLSAAVLLWDGERIATAASSGLPAPLAAQLDRYDAQLGPDASLLAAIAQGEPYLRATGDTDPRIRPILEASGIAAVAVAPIQVDAHVFGIVAAGVAVDIAQLRADAHLVTRLRGLASFAATAFQNAALLEAMQHESLHDHLTSLPNVRLLEDRAEQALAAARRSGGRVGLVFVDLDGFKAVNDRHGHLVGDDALRQFADRLRRLVREVDTVARYGGDEFAVLLPDVADRDAVSRVVGALLDAVRRPIACAGVELHLAASIGVAVSPRDGHDLTGLLKAADTAMYEMKRTGRVAVEV